MTSPLRATTDINTGDRLYENGIEADKQFLSVTTILGAIPKHFFLVPWAARLAAECAADEIENAMGHGQSAFFEYDEDGVELRWYGEASKERFITHCKDARTRNMEDAGDLGDDVHTAADQILSFSGGDPKIARQMCDNMSGLSDEARKRLGHLVNWLEDNEVEVIATEFTIYNDEYGYAGSCDLFAKVNGKYYMLDIKSGKSAHAETALQLTAYYKGEYLVVEEDDGTVTKLPVPWEGLDNVGGAVLHLQKTQMRFIPMTVGKEAFILFIRLLQVKKAMSMLEGFMGEPTYNSKKARKEREKNAEA